MKLDLEFDRTIARGVEIILDAVDAGDPEAARWLLDRDVELVAGRYCADGLLDAERLRSATRRAGELVMEASR
jgi:hypothetical protein